MDDPLEPFRPSALSRATDGGADRASLFSPASWRDEYGPGAAAGIGPAVLLGLVFAGQWFVGGPGAWGLSAQALAEGRWHTPLSHMLVHANLAHVWMNIGGVLALTPPALNRLGGPRPAGWGRYGLLFLASGLCGAALYLALHPFGVVPMVGASGALCGLWGVAARLPPEGGVAALTSRPVRQQVVAFLKMNVVLFVILFVLVRLSGGVGGLAWEAHLGGFLFGLLAGPRLAPRA
ncbi:rhomboid family intramembrane serine protease [Brevundimonas sp.]|uniref:rhomboid family intramembrane serine protease n=1 Tax=Brevundimonas sp. TaxID=1871086 RepID=UPI002D6367CD|nr:rhomboid family intramembrane serine protease [Brevundimonas sp.]HYC68077.1 rhomboid family intramembrane serine protease [Brevundimonas sp.]